MEINLLPQEYKPKEYAVKASKTLSKISFLFVVLFFIFAFISFGISIFIGQKLKTVKEDEVKLKARIKALQETEQKLVLIKDRIEKVRLVKDDMTASDKVDDLELVLPFTDPTKISKVVIDEEFATIDVSSDNSYGISTLINDVVTSNFYKKVKIQSITYNPERGYTVSLGLSN